MAKFAKGNRLAGSRKGCPNKSTISVKEGILLCYEDMGGRKAFAKWAKKNPSDFYSKIYSRMISTEPAKTDGVDEEYKKVVALVSSEMEKLI